MNAEEYIKQKEEMIKRHDKEIAELNSKYAFANNPHKEGDIIKSEYDAIIIQRILVNPKAYRTGLPECAYRGIKLKKDLTPRKDGESTLIYQSNIVNH